MQEDNPFLRVTVLLGITQFILKTCGVAISDGGVQAGGGT